MPHKKAFQLFRESLSKGNLPFFNLTIALTALGFQTLVLYPWHVQLEHDFERLKSDHENTLREFHDMKVQRFDGIDQKLEVLREAHKDLKIEVQTDLDLQEKKIEASVAQMLANHHETKLRALEVMDHKLNDIHEAMVVLRRDLKHRGE